MSFPRVGNLAPDFLLPNQNNENIHLKNFHGKNNLLVYFYPKASTPGCTVQACEIRDYYQEFKNLNIVVLGISPDKPAKLQKFDLKYNLKFHLLADKDHSVADAYGVWGLKKFMGREFMGILRTSFYIGLDGKLLHIFEKVNTKTHHHDVINYIKGII